MQGLDRLERKHADLIWTFSGGKGWELLSTPWYQSWMELEAWRSVETEKLPIICAASHNNWQQPITYHFGGWNQFVGAHTTWLAERFTSHPAWFIITMGCGIPWTFRTCAYLQKMIINNVYIVDLHRCKSWKLEMFRPEKITFPTVPPKEAALVTLRQLDGMPQWLMQRMKDPRNAQGH